MPEFIPILIVAVLMFLALLFLFSGTIFFVSPGTTLEPKNFLLGTNFNITYGPTTTKLTELSGNVSRGMLSGMDKSISFPISNFDNLLGVNVGFFVYDSNLYGKLIIDSNGHEIYRDYSYPGWHTAFIKKDYLKSQNVLRVDSESSGWRIWAPTVYIFTANVTGEYEGIMSRTFQFNLTNDEKNKATSGSLSIIGMGSGSGRIIAKLNGYEIYKGDVSASPTFSSDDLLPGINTIELSTEPFGSYRIDKLDATVYFGGTEEYCTSPSGKTMSLMKAKELAINSECGNRLTETHVCNENTGTWWIDLDIQQSGCSPACVVDVELQTAEINWRCTGLIT